MSDEEDEESPGTRLVVNDRVDIRREMTARRVVLGRESCGVGARALRACSMKRGGSSLENLMCFYVGFPKDAIRET